MKKNVIKILALFFMAVLISCTPKEEIENTTAEEKTTETTEEVTVPETKNVYYRGIIQPSGINIYQQGTHKLSLPDGRFILLESDTVDLNGYVGEEVEIFGALRPTVEGGGTIMRVERAAAVIEEAEEETDAEIADEPASSAKNEEKDVLEQETEEPEEEIAPDTKEETAEESPEKEIPPQVDKIEEEEEAKLPDETEIKVIDKNSEEYKALVETMSKQDYSADNWNQEYCSKHIRFCIPIHKYFWYRSFGATEKALWHVEFGTKEIENLGDGPLVLELLVGVEGQEPAKEGMATATSKWDDKSFFFIYGPSEISDAVNYMAGQIKSYNPDEEPEKSS